MDCPISTGLLHGKVMQECTSSLDSQRESPTHFTWRFPRDSLLNANGGDKMALIGQPPMISDLMVLILTRRLFLLERASKRAALCGGMKTKRRAPGLSKLGRSMHWLSLKEMTIFGTEQPPMISDLMVLILTRRLFLLERASKRAALCGGME